MSRVRLLLVAGTLSSAAVALLRVPAGFDHRGLGSWPALAASYAADGPEPLVLALVRATALVLVGWLLGACTLQLLASMVPRRGLQGLADAISPRSLQRAGRGLAGLSLTAGLAAPAPSAGIHLLLPDPPGSPGTATMRLEPPGTSSTTTTVPSTTTLPSTTVADPPPVEPAPALPGPEVVVVAPGDSFWSLAAEVVAEVVGPAPDERVVATYWRTLIEVNRSRLVDPTNPDLIYPGQELLLPDR